MKHETNEQLAREAAEEIAANHRTFGYHFDVEQIILASIEKAHQSGWHEGRQYQVEYGTPEQPYRKSIPQHGGKRWGVVESFGAACGTASVTDSARQRSETTPETFLASLQPAPDASAEATSEPQFYDPKKHGHDEGGYWCSPPAVATSEPQEEWTPEYVRELVFPQVRGDDAPDVWQRVAAAHNAAIDAEREHRKLVDTVLDDHDANRKLQRS